MHMSRSLGCVPVVRNCPCDLGSTNSTLSSETKETTHITIKILHRPMKVDGRTLCMEQTVSIIM
jgi:hypothetical protein